MTQEEYEEYKRDLKRIQEDHLRRVKENTGHREHQKCLHDECSQCHGTGKKLDGTACIHFISCPCPKCNPYFMSSPLVSSSNFPWGGSRQDWDNWKNEQTYKVNPNTNYRLSWYFESQQGTAQGDNND